MTFHDHACFSSRGSIPRSENQHESLDQLVNGCSCTWLLKTENTLDEEIAPSKT